MKIVSVKQLCEILDVSAHTVYGWRQQGIPTLIEKPLRFDLDAVIKWFQEERDIVRKNFDKKGEF